MQVHNIKVTQLEAYEPGTPVLKLLNWVTVFSFLFTIYQGKMHTFTKGTDQQIDLNVSLICLGVTAGIWILRLFLKHAIYPSRKNMVNGIVADIRDSLKEKPRPNGTQKEVQIDDEFVDRVITTLKIGKSLTKRNKKSFENVTAVILARYKYNRAISRMYQNNLIIPNQGIFTTQGNDNYFTLSKELINLGIIPSKVYFEDSSDHFAIVVENLEDAHFGLLANIQEPEHEYVSTNDILQFIGSIKII